MSADDQRDGARTPDERRLDQIIWPALRRMGISRKVRDAQLDDVLALAVGPALAALCQPAGLDRGVLTIATAHGALAHQLQLDSPRLIASLNQHLGSEVVRRLRFRALDGGASHRPR
jgi:hypothetical protein